METKPTEEAWRTLLNAHAVVLDAIERQLQREAGMPLTWHEVLIRLSEAPDGSLRMQDLADRLVLSRSGVTRLVDRLEAAGLIERASCPSDRRGTYAVLTDAGRSALERLQPLLRPAVQQHFGRYLTEPEAELLRSILDKLLTAHGYVKQGEACVEAPEPAEATTAGPGDKQAR